MELNKLRNDWKNEQKDFAVALSSGLISEISRGNGGALHVLVELTRNFGPGLMEPLQKSGILGPEIWLLYKDICGEDMNKFSQVLVDGSALEKLSGCKYSSFYKEKQNTQTAKGTQTANGILKNYDSAIQANVTGNKLTVVEDKEFSFGKMHNELVKMPMTLISAPKSEIGDLLKDLLGGSSSKAAKNQRGKVSQNSMNLDNIESTIATLRKVQRPTPVEIGISPGEKSRVLSSKQVEKALAHDIEYSEAEMYLMDSIRKGTTFTADAIDLIVNVASHMRKFAVVEMKKIALEKGIAPLASKLHQVHVTMNKGSE